MFSMRNRFSEFLATTEVLLLSAVRRGLYPTILVSVLAPALLLVVLFSIPDFRSFSYSYADGGKAVLALFSVESGGGCHPAEVVEGALAAGDASLRALTLVVDAEPSELLKLPGLAERNFTAGVVLPRDVYASLGSPREVAVLLGQDPRNYTVAGSWGSNVVLLVGPGLTSKPGRYACLLSQRDVLVGVLEGVEEDLLSTAALWASALSLAYLPVLYAAQRRVAESLRKEARVLFDCGASTRSILASTATALALLHVLGVFHASSLGVVLVYAAWSLLSYVLVLPPPALRVDAVWLLALEILLGALAAYPASRGAVAWR